MFVFFRSVDLMASKSELMKKLSQLSFLLSLLFLLFSACTKEDPEIGNTIDPVSQFVYDGMSIYYYWSGQNGFSIREPKITDDPEDYFYDILHSTDTKNSWSWITDDVEALLADFEGKSLSFGYNLGFTLMNDDEVYAIVKYVYNESPADKGGLQRLDLIGKVNGQPIKTVERDGGLYVSDESIDLLYGADPVTFTTYLLSGNTLVEKNEMTITPDDSAKDPVLYNHIYTNGDKKIGYLFYTNFYDNFNDHLYEVFSNFKQAGVTDLILDLRYNTGGDVSAALYLASLIAPREAVENQEPFVVMDYNDLLNSSFDKWYDEAKPADKYKYDRKDYLGTFSTAEQNPLGANLDLDKVYIIATGGSYSASELTIHCLKPYMDVVHIGENTGGKYAASWTIHGYDEEVGVTVYDESDLSSTEKNALKNWAMQLIVAMFANKDEESFSQTGHLVPDIALKEGFGYFNYWAPIGDPEDVFLGQALYEITGDENYQPQQPSSARRIQSVERSIHNTLDEMAKPIIIDNQKLDSKDFQKLREIKDLISVRP